MPSVGELFVTVSADASGLAAGLSRAEQHVERFGSRLFFLGSRITAGVTLPIVGAASAIAGFGVELDEAMSNSVAIMGEEGQRLKGQMADLAVEISKTSKFSASEIAKGYYDLASAGLDAQESMQSIGTVTMFAQAGLMDMSTAGEYLAGSVAALGPMIRTMGDETDESAVKVARMARVADVLTEANNLALGTVEDFANALTNRAASAMRMYNISLEEGTAALMVYASQNIRGHKAGQQLWMVLRDLQMATLRASGAWKEYGINVFQSPGKMRPLADILQTMTDKMKGMSDLEKSLMFKQLSLQDRSRAALQMLLGHHNELREYTKSLYGAAGTAADVSAKQMKAFAYQWAQIKHQFQASFNDIWKVIAPVLERDLFPILAQLATKLSEVAVAFRDMSETGQRTVLLATAMVAAFGPAIAILGSWVLMWAGISGTMTASLKVISGVFGTLGTSMGATAAVAGSSVGVWTGVVAVMRSLTPVVTTVLALFSAFKAGIGWMLEDADRMKYVFYGLMTLLGGPFGVALVAVIEGVSALTYALTGLTVGEAVVAMLTGLGRALSEVFTLFSEVVTVVQFGFLKVFQLLALVGSDVVQMFQDLVRAATDLVQTKLGSVFETFNNYLRESPQLVRDVVDQLKNMALTIYGNPVLLALILGYKAAKTTQSGFDIIGRKWDALVGQARTELGGSKPGTAAPSMFLPSGGSIGPGSTFLSSVGTGQYRIGMDLSSIGPGMEGVPIYPEIPKKDPKVDRWADEVKRAGEALMGGGGRGWAATLEFYAKNKALVESNEVALRNLWEQYKRIQDTVDPNNPLIQGLKEAASTIRAQEAALAAAADPARQFVDAMTSGSAKMGNVEKYMHLLINRVRELGPLVEINSEFFRENRDELGRLMGQYATLPPEIQIIIDAYSDWIRKTDQLDEKTQALVRQTMKEMGDSLEQVAAKTRDKEEELALFRMNESERSLRASRKGWEETLAANDKHYRDRLAVIVKFEGAALIAALERAKQEKDAMDKLAGTERRLALERAAASIGVNKQIVLSFKNMTDKVLEGFIKIKGEFTKWLAFTENLKTGFQALADVFDAAGTGMLTWLVKLIDLGQQGIEVGKDLRIAGLTMAEAFGEGGIDWEMFAAGAVSAFVAIAQGIKILDQATSSTSKFQNVLGGAMTGAQMGTAIMPGWGTAIGAVVGGLVGLFKKNAYVDVMRRVGENWGVAISEGLAQQISEQAKTMFGNNRQAAELFNIDKIIAEAGGVSSSNVVKMLDRLHDVFSMVHTGAFTAAQGLDTFSRAFGSFATFAEQNGLDVATVMQSSMRAFEDMIRLGKMSTADMRSFLASNFGAFADSFQNSGRVASATFLDLLRMHRELGIESKAVFDFLSAQTAAASTAWATVITSFAGAFDTLKEDIANARTAIEELSEAATDPENVQAAQDLADVQKTLNDLLTRQQGLVQAHSGDLQRMGALILGTFNAAIAQGVGWVTALQNVSPALDTLIGAWNNLGMSTKNVALQELVRYRQMMQNNQELFAGVDALSQGTLALSALGGITQTTFDALQQQGLEMYSRMQSAAEQSGGTTVDALRPMVPWLTAMRDAANEYGLALDANTQMLIDQAVELGLLKPTAQTTTQMMQSMFESLETVLRDVAAVLLEIKNNILGIPTSRNVTVTTTYVPDPDGLPPVLPPQAPDGTDTPSQSASRAWTGTTYAPPVASPAAYAADPVGSVAREASGTLEVTLVMPSGEVLTKQVIKTAKTRGWI